jgi:hypothetical protein
MQKVTPRIPIHKQTYDLIGRILNSNCFSTLRGKLIHVENDKCYFEIVENKEFTKYNHCAGQIDYLPESMVVTMKFEEE